MNCSPLIISGHGGSNGFRHSRLGRFFRRSSHNKFTRSEEPAPMEITSQESKKPNDTSSIIPALTLSVRAPQSGSGPSPIQPDSGDSDAMMEVKEFLDADEEDLLQVENVLPGIPRLAVQGIQGSHNDIFKALRQRGFVIYLAVQRPGDVVDVAIGLGPKLATHLALEKGIAVCAGPAMTGYTELEASTLAAAAIPIIGRSELKINDCFLLHSKDALSVFTNESRITAPQPDEIASYFGSGVAFYFLWLKFYTLCLLPIGIAGLVLFVWQMSAGTHDVAFAPIFCILVAIWCCLFLILWKRKSNVSAFEWGVLGLENEADLEDLASKDGVPAPSMLSRLCLSIPISALSIYVCIVSMMYCIHLTEHAEETYGTSFMRHWPTVVYSVVPLILSSAYTYVAEKLVIFEGHTLESKKRDSMITKQFGFSAVNYTCALVYTAFGLQNFSLLQSMLFSLTVTKQIVGNLQEIGIPLAMAWWKLQKTKKAAGTKANVESATQATTEEAAVPLLDGGGSTVCVHHVDGENRKVDDKSVGMNAESKEEEGRKETGGGGGGDNTKEEVEGGVLFSYTDKLSVEDFNAQLAAPPFEVGDEYLEMVVQFLFSTMFAVAFPLAPLLAFGNNVVEYRIDSKKLLSSRRPAPYISSSIGSWQVCLNLTAFAATLFNCLLLVLMGDQVAYFTPVSLKGLLTTKEGKVVLALLLEHCLLIFKELLSALIPDKPLWLSTRTAKLELQKRDKGKKDRFAAHSIKMTEHRETEAEKSKKQAIQKIRHMAKTAEVWGWSPRLLSLSLVPILFFWNGGYGAMWGAVVVLFVMSYAQHTKETADAGLVLGVVSDPNVLKLIKGELPHWFYDSEVERVNWLNSILEQFWIPASKALNKIIEETVAPLLDENKPPGVSRLGFSKATLGTIPIQVVGIRALKSDDNCVTLDLEVKWAADARFSFEVGRETLPLVIKLSKLRFSGHLRVELSPLVPVVPCFGAVSVCFMEKPYVDFSLKLAGLDVMSLGPGDANVSNAVGKVIKSIIETMMLFPKKMVIPMIDDVDIKSLSNPAPVGVLLVTINGARNLRKADTFGKSDPFVVLTLTEQTFQTKVIPKTLDPTWNESFEILIHDPAVQQLELEVFDEDFGPAKNDSLGNCQVPLSVLVPHKNKGFNIPLTDTPTGSVQFKLKYLPLHMGDEENENEEDMVFLSADKLDDMLVATDEYVDSPKPSPSPTSSGKGLGKLKAAAYAVGGVNKLGRMAAAVPESPSGIKSDSLDMGVLTVMNLEVAELSGKRKTYVVVKQGHYESRTKLATSKVAYAFDDIFHVLVRGSLNASVQVCLVEKSLTGEKEIGYVNIRIQEIITNSGSIDGEWHLKGDKAEGTIQMRLIFKLASRPKH